MSSDRKRDEGRNNATERGVQMEVSREGQRDNTIETTNEGGEAC